MNNILNNYYLLIYVPTVNCYYMFYSENVTYKYVNMLYWLHTRVLCFDVSQILSWL